MTVTWRSCSKLPGLRDLNSTTLTVHLALADFNDWWEPYTLGVGPPGDYVARLDDDGPRAAEGEVRAVVPAERPVRGRRVSVDRARPRLARPAHGLLSIW